eukprot:5256169-Pleurochrysis_carterae.AAC.1
MYPACERVRCPSCRSISTLSKSDTGPSSSTFHRDARASVNLAYCELGALSRWRIKRSST